ncbi:flavin reductase family protein, partial [Candidatus Bathyarchaeota archaeon]|nr:flavin reductase family protein [Candidatus Bathyarchaeota archaeon]
MEVRKTVVDLSSAYRFLYPRQVVLLSCTDKTGQTNIITLAWSMPASIDPPMLILGIGPKRYSHELIEETEEFVVNVPTMEILRETLFCGRRTGREYDKFKETGLTPLPAKTVKPAIIKECVSHLECRLHQQIIIGDHTLFVGEVLAAYADKEAFDERYDLQKVKPI